MPDPITTWQLTFSSGGRQPLFPTEATRRAAIRTLLRVTGDALVLFSIVDDHVHVVLFCPRPLAGRRAQALHRALAPVASAPLRPAHISAVEDRSHLRWLVTYLLRQPVKHQLGEHPALWTGGCFADLVGARLPGTLATSLRLALPRFRLRTAYGAVGLPPVPIEALDDRALASCGLGRIVSATAAALCLDPALSGSGAAIVDARRAVVAASTVARFPAGHVAETLGISPRTVRRYRQEGADAGALRAVRMRLALEDVVRAASLPG